MPIRKISLSWLFLAPVLSAGVTWAQSDDIPQAVSGKIEVPENWDKPTGRLLTLTYARQLSKNLSPIADPIIFFAGGPGGSILASQGSAGFDFSYLRETRMAPPAIPSAPRTLPTPSSFTRTPNWLPPASRRSDRSLGCRAMTCRKFRLRSNQINS